MKRRLLSAFLAVMMVLTMAPVAFAADGTNTSVDSYEKLVQAVANASDGDTITLADDIIFAPKTAEKGLQPQVMIQSDITLDLNNHKIAYTDASMSDNYTGTPAILSIMGGATVTITGNGTIDAELGMNNSFGINVTENSNLIVENGNFYGATTAIQVQEGSLLVYGGNFDLATTIKKVAPQYAKYIVNCIDSAFKNGTARIQLVSGTYGYDFANKPEGENTTYLPSGYETVQKDNAYSVHTKSGNAAEIGDIQYATLADAVAAAQGGETVKLLKDVTEDVIIPADKTITLDLNGKKLTNVASHTIFNNGTLTINGEGTVDNVTHGKVAVYNIGTVSLNGGTYDRSKEDGTKDSNTYYTLLNHGTMTVRNVTVNNKGGYSSLFENGYFDYSKSRDGIDNPTLTIESGTFTGGINTVKNDDGATMTINGGIFTNYAQSAFQNHNIATINGGTFNGATVYAILNCGATCSSGDAPDQHQLTITGGNFNGKIYKGGDSKDGKTHYDIGSISISGGYFTVDPSAYCVTGKTGVPSNRTDEYVWTVGKKSETKAEVATGEPTVDTSNVTTNTDADKKLLEATKTALSSTEVEGNGIATAAAAAANNNTVTADETVVNQLKKATSDNTVTTENTNIVIQTYMDMTITGVDASSEKKTITVDIQPMYRTVATTADVKNGGEIVLKGEDSKAVNAVQIGNPQKLVVSGETTVSIQLPNDFVTDETAKIFVQHKGYEYEATVTKDNTGVYTATFTNPHGFSPFTISMTSQAVAQIGETKYTSLQDAVNAVAANGTIEIIGGTSPYTGTANKTFTVKNGTLADITVNGQTIKPTKSYTFKYTHSSGGSSGGSSSGKTTYKVTTSAVNNGGVNASPSTAEKGATITLTLSPDKGYKLDKLTVTDGSGKSVSTVKKSDTVYTFTMPASAVTVGVSYAKADETPSKTTFNDVSANDWFASAVDYVTGKGMMNGTADNTFSPKANTTRGMVVTVLYRLENQPSTSAASFTDVASGAYYANAVAWANANGIVSGYGSGKFGPNDKVTREQLAAILYRYAQYKKYDVSVGEDTNILSYDDAQSISSYAIPAIQWACGAGVVTGKSGSKLDPKGNATRAEVAAMLMRFCENVK